MLYITSLVLIFLITESVYLLTAFIQFPFLSTPFATSKTILMNLVFHSFSEKHRPTLWDTWPTLKMSPGCSSALQMPVVPQNSPGPVLHTLNSFIAFIPFLYFNPLAQTSKTILIMRLPHSVLWDHQNIPETLQTCREIPQTCSVTHPSQP